MGEATRQVGAAAFWSTCARLGRFFLSLVSSVIIVRGLGSHDYGVLSLVRTILVFSSIFAGAGLGQALLKFLPVLRVSRGGRGTVFLVRRVVVFQVLFWLILLTIVFFSREGLEKIFFFEHFSGVGNVIFIAVWLSIAEVFFNLFSNILSACYDTKRFSMAAILNHLILIVFVLIFLHAGYGVLGILYATAIGNIAACGLLLGKVKSHLKKEEELTNESRIGNKRLFRFSIPFAAIGILNMIVWRQSETLFLAHYRSAAETGFFNLAYQLPQTMLAFIPLAVWPIILAGFSEVYEKDKSNILLAIEKFYKVLFLLSAPICLGGIAFAGRLVPILFGGGMAPAAVPMQVFFGIFAVSVFSSPLSMSLYVMEKTHINLLICIILATLNVGLDIILIPRYGLFGAVLPVSLVIVLAPFLYKIALNRFLSGIRIPYFFIGKCFLASLSILLLYPVIVFVNGVFQLMITIFAGVLVMVFSFKKLKVLGKEEVDLLTSFPVSAANRFIRFMSS